MRKNIFKLPIISFVISNLLVIVLYLKSIYLFKFFGYIFSFIFLFFVNPFVFISLWFFSLSFDCFQLNLLPFKFTGMLGEYVWIFSKKIYFINILLLLIRLGFLIYKKYRTITIRHFLSDYSKKNNVDLSAQIDKLLQFFSIPGKVYKKFFGEMYSTYYINLDKTVKHSRFEALSVDFTESLGLKVKNHYDLDFCAITVENTEKQKIGFKSLFKYTQPNCYLSINCGGHLFLINILENIFVKAVDLNYLLRSLLTSILITKMNLEVFICNCEKDIAEEFEGAFYFMDDETKVLAEAVELLEKRSHEIFKYYKDIYTYQQKQKFFYLLIIFRNTKNLDKESLDFLISNGKKVGIFVMVCDESYKNENIKIVIEECGEKIYEFRKGDFTNLLFFPENEEDNNIKLIEFLRSKNLLCNFTL